MHRRLVAKKMREAAADMKEDIVNIRQDDASLKEFEFPFRNSAQSSDLVNIKQLSTRCPETGGVKITTLDIARPLKKGDRLQVKGSVTRVIAETFDMISEQKRDETKPTVLLTASECQLLVEMPVRAHSSSPNRFESPVLWPRW